MFVGLTILAEGLEVSTLIDILLPATITSAFDVSEPDVPPAEITTELFPLDPLITVLKLNTSPGKSALPAI